MSAPAKITIAPAPPKITIAPAPVIAPQPIIIDRGVKTAEQYEYFPAVQWTGPCVPSFDIGKKHFAAFVQGQQPPRCLYAGVWKLGEKMTPELQERLTALLARLDSFFSTARIVLVEQQQASNYMAVRIQQHVLSYLELRHPHAERHNVAATIKYTRLDGPLGDQKHARKQWAVDKACELLDARRDGAARLIRELHALRNDKEKNLKGDDVSDAYLQYEAWMTQLKPAQKIRYLH
jgi:hypothetical protein